jgi:predicted metal-dependent phosphoesterase TrpH
VDTELFAPARAQKRFVLEWRPEEAARSRAVFDALAELPGWELVILRTRPLTTPPYVPRRLRDRVRVRRALDAESRAREVRGAAGFVPVVRGSARPALEAAAAGVPTVDPPGAAEQPRLLGATLARLAEDDAWRARRSAEAEKTGRRESFAALADELERHVYRPVVARLRRAEAADPLADRPYIVCDLHMHTSHSHDCSIPVQDLLDHAEAEGLGAIAITDHNVFGGARQAVELARGRRLKVIPGEEMMTTQGEVIGLFLSEEIPRDMSMEDTVTAIREQGGVVYLPHPFDRLHSIPDSRTLHRLLEEVDVFEVYNARLLRDGFNDEALRFARKYNLLMGAGSDAHVLQGVGSGALRMRAFETPEEFLISLRTAEVLRRPKSLVYLQSLKWMAQAKERRAKTAAGSRR